MFRLRTKFVEAARVGNESLVKALLLAHSGFSFLGSTKLCQRCCSFLKTRALQHVNMSPPHMHSPCSSLLLSQAATHLTPIAQ